MESEILADVMVYLGDEVTESDKPVLLILVNRAIRKVCTKRYPFGYSDEENAWCKKNEKAIWEHICSNDHLHARDPMIIRYYMKPAPAVEMLGGQAPASVGIWIGAQIVSSYMKKHKDMKLKDLLEFTDYHEMLNQSDYLAS